MFAFDGNVIAIAIAVDCGIVMSVMVMVTLMVMYTWCHGLGTDSGWRLLVASVVERCRLRLRSGWRRAHHQTSP